MPPAAARTRGRPRHPDPDPDPDGSVTRDRAADPRPDRLRTPPSDPADPTAPTTRPSGPTKPPTTGETTLTGRIESGVEPGCLLLDGYLLLGGPRDVLTSGATVTVTGRADATIMTTCQQGIPFVVASAKGG
ncbi:hypothetical protein [Micromonospora tarapacensis]|uniref:hypothetical protein n=1 Tax=Micromonospora tarapacensis TaxID=2835305 RepID=UPI001E41B499|nr:hypothetical protein [Micromonospora tarapacensis]